MWLVSGVRADTWDDFANNLATDLAPLLALFGEQVTKQYLSESVTRIDNFIFAMAPLGILTAVVSAIRVCGSASLRAFIGRAQEGGGNAEAELCSSTSRDVCELYHNGGIARVFGRPKVLELVHNPQATDFYPGADSKVDSKPTCGVHTFQGYFANDVAKEWEECLKTKTRNRGTEEPSPKNLRHAPNPNLSLNIGIKKHHPFVFWIAATLGFLLQASVMVFGMLATYKLDLRKNGRPPPPWAFPLTLTGTTLLCSGMFFCAVLIERSTEERVFKRKEPFISAFYWLQPGNQVVGDQTFDAFAYSDSGRPITEYITSWKATPSEGWFTAFTVWAAVGTTMCGFVLQFVGLRAMHSAVSIFQLAAILSMSIIRASLRTRRLDKHNNCLGHVPDLIVGHELDWLTLRM
ncbi:hypothetical protein GQ44DRAFT_619201, partial [Phaeosphaeriaceae sp. PMI808]